MREQSELQSFESSTDAYTLLFSFNKILLPCSFLLLGLLLLLDILVVSRDASINQNPILVAFSNSVSVSASQLCMCLCVCLFVSSLSLSLSRISISMSFCCLPILCEKFRKIRNQNFGCMLQFCLSASISLFLSRNSLSLNMFCCRLSNSL